MEEIEKNGKVDIQKDVIEPINRREIKTKDMAIQLKVSEKELKQYIKNNGYVWKGSKYMKKEEVEAVAEVPIVEIATEKVKVTYRIDKELHKLIRLQAMIEDTDNSAIIEKAILNYVSDKAKEILKNM